MPASSGAPVLFDTCTIAGVHTGALFHLDNEYIKTDQHEVSFVIVAACQFKHASGHKSLSCLCICMFRKSPVCMQQHGMLLHTHGCGPLLHNTGMGTAYRSQCFVNVQDAPRSRIDKDERDMWWPQEASMLLLLAIHQSGKLVPLSVTKQSKE